MATTAPSDDSGKLAFWDSRIEAVYQTPDGNFASALEIFSRGGHNSKLNKEPIGTRFIRREHHGKSLKKDKNGWAFCPVCKQIFNCDYQDDDTPISVIMASGYVPKETNAPPPRSHRKPRRAAR